MNIKALAAALLALTVSAGGPPVRAQAQAQPPAQPDDVAAFVHQLEPIIQRADVAAFLALVADSADRTRALSFTTFELPPGARRVVVQERDRVALAGAPAGRGYRLILEIFADHVSTARISTWQLDIVRGGAEGDWRIANEDRVTSVESLYRMTLNPAKQFDARDLKITAEDLDLTLVEGSVFVADVDLGVTAMVLMGHGEMHFHPAPASEKGQVKIFCGAETLDARFDAAYIRINPGDFNTLIDSAHLTERSSVDPKMFRRADDVFREESPRSFLLDLGDLSREPWTLMPPSGDFLAEIRTRRHDTLTYARSAAESEDVTLFDRKRQKNISVYPSEQKIARRGSPFYSDDEQADFDVLHNDIDVAYSPERQWIDGRAQVRLKVRAGGLNTLTMRLADPLVVQSISSDRFGRLFGIRVRNQHSVVISLPATVVRGTELTISMTYAGRLEPQPADRETLALDQAQQPPRGPGGDDMPIVVPEPSLLYSNRSVWYPQGNSTDYATSTIRITLPATYDCVASGSLVPGAPELIPAKGTAVARKLYVFEARQPLRYLAFIVSRFARAETVTVGLDRTSQPDGDMPALSGIINHSLNLAVEANPRQVAHGHELIARATDIAQFYASIIGDAPYPSFTLALVESDLPGGHSPAYFAALNQPLPTSPFVWRNDPTAFINFPEFFAAHEIAHQWWGQAVGWQNYHEQWISEGFAQYFAALYAQHLRGDEAFGAVMKQMRKWAMADSDQGPVYLGYRLGHIHSEGRVFRALVYDKGAAVLHMLRRLVGDEAFFRGLQRFYRESRFKKVGTDDFRVAMEKESGRSLTRFFDRWIYGFTLAKVKFSYRVDGGDVVLHAEQTGEVFDVPLTVTLQYADKRTDVIFPVTERTSEMRVALAGPLRGVEVSKDDGTLAEITHGT
ncbi:MAG TPA: M1 family aminopeptidase [Vicinamibacterales bacterium]|jgi:hypothetical protein